MKAAGQWLTALYFSPAPPKRAPLCAERPAALTVYRPRQRSHLAFFLHKHNAALGSASPCSLLQPDTWTWRASFQSDTARRSKQKSHCMCSFCLQLGSVSTLKTTVESSGVTLILARGIQCHNGIVEVDRPLKLCSRHKTVQICIDVCPRFRLVGGL